MPIDHHLVAVLSYYRSAELHGAALLLRVLARMPHNPAMQVQLTRHVADETRHAWLWTQRIIDMGATPASVKLGYQERLGLRLRPRGIAELFALSILVERRSLERYSAHVSRQNVDPQTRKVLRAVMADEAWHVESLMQHLGDLSLIAEERLRLDTTIERFRVVEQEVFDTLVSMEGDGVRVA